MFGRDKQHPRKVGWSYVIYHILVVIGLGFSAFKNLTVSYRSTGDFIWEILFAVLLYPAIVPALSVCGGLHGGGCESWLGLAFQVVIFSITIMWAVVGLRVIFLFIFSRT
jgi:hypothetical protein